MANNNSMIYRPLGRCGARVSAFGLGGWTTFGGSLKDQQTIDTILTRAFEAGINFFDIADVYAQGQSEIEMGRVLKKFPRHRLVISSKVFFPLSEDVNDRGLSRKHIFESIDKSLKRIGTDYLDIYFCHRFDPATPLEETARAMDDLVHQGKILYWGTSEWTAEQLNEVHKLCDKNNLYHPQVEQPEYSLLARDFEKNVRQATADVGMGVVVWSPLASGLLTGKYRGGVPPDSRLARIEWLRKEQLSEDRLAKVEQLIALADRARCTPAQLALAWTVNQPGVTSVILGATKISQLEENLKSLEIKISDALAHDLDRAFS